MCSALLQSKDTESIAGIYPDVFSDRSTMLNVHATTSPHHSQSTSSLHTRVSAEPGTSRYCALAAATIAVSSTPTGLGQSQVQPFTPDLKTVRTLQCAWRGWKLIQRIKGRTQSGKAFIETVYPPCKEELISPNSKNKKSQRWGMINYTPVDGRGPTLSHYYRNGPTLGKGTYATVREGPRGYALRIPIEGGDSNAATIDYADYKDLSSFIPLTWISEERQICRNAGTDLYHYFACERRSLTLSDFKTASADLKHLHRRKLYHMDIKLENMACKIVDGKPLLSFIDCDSITNDAGVANAAITYPREKLRPSDVERILPSGKADDEYAFLLLLMMVTDLSFGPL